MRKLVWIAVASLVFPGTAQSLVLCTTPDGKTYVGDKPPPGCEVKSSYQSAPEAPTLGDTAVAPGGASTDDFSVRASRARTELERALNRDAASLEEIRKRIEDVQRIEPQGDPNYVVTQQDIVDAKRRAAAQGELRDAERRTLVDIAELWRAFDELDAKVVERYGGKAPDWWRRALSCPKCPSKNEVQNAVR
jgi:hypothetical protein